MRSNLENNIARQLRLLSPTHENLTATLIGSFIIPDDGPMFHFLDGGAADRTVFLPTILPQGGLQYIIANTGTTNTLNVVDSNGVAVASLAHGNVGIFISSKTGWVAFVGISYLEIQFIEALMSEPRVVTGDFVVGSTDTTIAIQKAAPVATAGTLPTVASRNGKPVSVVDWSTAIVGHTITLTPNGAETIMKQATWSLVSNAANLASMTLWPSTTLNGWYTKP